MSLEVKKGEVFLFTHGDYSDYCINGQFQAERDFNLRDMAEAFQREIRDADRYGFSEREFIEWLEKNGVVKGLPIRELFLGDRDLCFEDR